MCAYGIWLSFGCWVEQLGFKWCLGWYWVLNSNSAKQIFFFSLSKAGWPVVLVLNIKIIQSFIILLLCSCTSFFLLGMSFTVRVLYIILGIKFDGAEYPCGVSLLLLNIPHRRQCLEQ